MSIETHPLITNAVLYAWTFPGEAADALDRQLTEARTWAQTEGGTVLATYTDNTSRNASCPELERAIWAAQAQGAALVCARPERLRRTFQSLIACVADCHRRGVPIFFATGAGSQEAVQTLARLKDTWVWPNTSFRPDAQASGRL
jgi:DNA invertase Pin-like site-specific DNA recombinase